MIDRLITGLTALGILLLAGAALLTPAVAFGEMDGQGPARLLLAGLAATGVAWYLCPRGENPFTRATTSAEPQHRRARTR